MKRRLVLPLILFLLTDLLFGQIHFDQIQALKGDRAIFTAVTPSPGNGDYKTLFYANLADKTMEQLTFFPEKVFYLPQSGQIQFHNRFGVFRSDKTLNDIARVDNFPSFVSGNGLSSGKILPLEASRDGRFIVYLEKKNAVTANLYLFDVQTSKISEVSTDLQLSLDQLPAMWSPDSQYFVYEKNQSIYYYSIQQMLDNRIPTESFRRLGAGTLANVAWSPRSELFYVSGRLVYRILTGEFFTRALYGGQFRTGTIMGKIPDDFEPQFDRFWISPTGEQILLSRSGQRMYLYNLVNNDFFKVDEAPSLPYLLLPRDGIAQSVLWTYDNQILILVGTLSKDGHRMVYRLKQDGSPRFVLADKEEVRDLYLSPDEQNVLVLRKGKSEIRNVKTWSKLTEVAADRPLWGYWLDDAKVIISGYSKTQTWSINTGVTSLVCFSQPGTIGEDSQSSLPGQVVNNNKWLWSPDKKIWEQKDSITFSDPTVVSENYRVYLKMISGYAFENVVMMRNLAGVNTIPLFSFSPQEYEEFPSQEEPVDFVRFTHGSRIRRREVALVFNALDNAEGVSTVLHVLKTYGIKATFFINGDFIRQNPGATKEIAKAGHETANLFYVNYAMGDPRYKLGKDFLKQGLARNEDDYYNATGQELSLLWHAPDYYFNSEIEEITEELNYIYVDKDVDPLDWVSLEDQGRYGNPYLSSREIVQKILDEKKPGSVIPIRLGKLEGRRDDYLFQNLDLLIDGLIEVGYDIVSVSDLLEHSR
ncbi:polysaccharide deacetylase family protein [Spirochaeta cellobiosiphila]|uniref:polysaccharide deacetylase family protein n=1 Tax=Spirochaeta cellobiosiphila TaxID=504483 RepID=UPI00069F198B|nr:polysaccharide deacetylase family protein [Spirochaeta cellobiosiphila]